LHFAIIFAIKNGMKWRGIFTIQEFKNPNKTTSYRVTGTKLDGVRVRENFPSEAEALAAKQNLEVEAANFIPDRRITTTRLTTGEEADAEAAIAFAKSRGVKWSLLFMAEYTVANYRDPLKRISVEDAVKRFTAEKKSANRRARYLKDLELELGYLTAKHGSKMAHEVQKEDLVEIIGAGERGAERQNNIRKDYRTFFNWCVANGYTQSNPAELVPIKTVERAEIATLPLNEVRELMKVAAGYKGGKLVPYVALATFCAIRPDELARLSWDQIDLDERQVTITASAAKKRGRRVVDIPENCVAWLSPYEKKKDKPPIKGTNWRKDFDWVKARVGYGNPERMPQGRGGKDKEKWAKLKPWPQDVLRHTGISCHYRLHENEGKTAAWAGNSPDMIHAHYRALISAKDAKAFFEIVPGQKGGVASGAAHKAKGKIVELENALGGKAAGERQGLEALD
jgi:integrase